MIRKTIPPLLIALILSTPLSAAADRCPNGTAEEIVTTCGELAAAASAYDVAIARVQTLESRIDTLVTESLKLRTERDTERARADYLAAELAATPPPRHEVLPYWLPDVAMLVGSAMSGVGGALAVDGFEALPVALLSSGVVLAVGGLVLDIATH